MHIHYTCLTHYPWNQVHYENFQLLVLKFIQDSIGTVVKFSKGNFKHNSLIQGLDIHLSSSSSKKNLPKRMLYVNNLRIYAFNGHSVTCISNTNRFSKYAQICLLAQFFGHEYPFSHSISLCDNEFETPGLVQQRKFV